MTKPSKVELLASLAEQLREIGSSQHDIAQEGERNGYNSRHNAAHCLGSKLDSIARELDDISSSLRLSFLPDEPAPSTTDECDHDFVLQHRSSINICRHCGIRETPSIAGRMAAKRALKEAFKHFDAPSPTTGADVQWTEAHNAATYLQHHIGEGDEGACNALDTIDKFILSHPTTSPTKPEGLEWGKDDRLLFNKRGIGSAYHDPNKGGDYAWDFLDNDGGREKSLEDAKAALFNAAQSWLSTVSDASERAWLIEQRNPTSYFCAGKNGFHWSKDANDALRFSRRQDAEGFAIWCSINVLSDCKVAEHMWPDNPVSDASDTIGLNRREANLCRQWFDAVQDLNDAYLFTEDAVLAVSLYRHLGIEPSRYLLKCASLSGGAL